MSTIYLASRYSRRLELCGYRDELEQRGHSVPARWLHGEHQVHGLEASRAVEGDGPVPAEQAVLFAEDDVEDIIAADVMVNFTEEPRAPLGTRGGRHTELGIVLGLKFAESDWVEPRKLYVVGPIENIFMALPEVDGRFDDFAAFLAAYDDGRIKL